MQLFVIFLALATASEAARSKGETLDMNDVDSNVIEDLSDEPSEATETMNEEVEEADELDFGEGHGGLRTIGWSRSWTEDFRNSNFEQM